MASSIQRRRGTTSDHATFTGAVGEITIDTTKDTVVVHDGAVVGGVPLLREDGSNSSLALGSQGVPSLKFSGDPNTGIYSPGADQLAVATNGTGRLFIDATGNVGVGPIQSPSWASASSTVLSIVDSAFANVAALRVEGPTTVTEVGAGPSFTWAGSFSNHSYILYTNTIERARIRADGTFEIKGAGTAGTSPGFSVSPSTPANSFVIDSSGRLGIGTSDVRGTLGLQHGNTSPQGLNDVAIDALRISQSVGGIVAIRTTQYDAVNQPAAGDTQFFNLYFNGSTYNYYERMRIRADGCVGIGTTSPSSKLSIGNGAATNDGLTITFTGDNSTLARFYASTSTGEVSIGGIAASYFPTFYAAGSEKARIDTSGRLLVGTSTERSVGLGSVYPAKLEVETTAYAAISAVNNSNDVQPAHLCLGKSRGGIGGITVVQNGDGLGVIRFAGADGTDLESIGAEISVEVDGTVGANDMPGRLVFSTNPGSPATGPTERMRIKADGDVSIVTGNLIIGTAGKGIDFSADGSAAGMTSELLDDYEVGTWTLSGISASANGNIHAKYIKIGSQITCFYSLETYSSTITIGSTISGFPFSLTSQRFFVGGTWGQFIQTGSAASGDVITNAGGTTTLKIMNNSTTSIDGFGAQVNLMFSYTI